MNARTPRWHRCCLALGGKTGSAKITLTVVSAQQPTLNVSVATDKSSYVNGNKVLFTATVTGAETEWPAHPCPWPC